MDWLLISCIASFAVALILGVVLTVFWLADRADDRALDERMLGECPWPIARKRDRTSSHDVPADTL